MHSVSNYYEKKLFSRPCAANYLLYEKTCYFSSGLSTAKLRLNC